MKKILLLLLLFSFMAGIVSCGSSDDDNVSILAIPEYPIRLKVGVFGRFTNNCGSCYIDPVFYPDTFANKAVVMNFLSSNYLINKACTSGIGAGCATSVPHPVFSAEYS